MPGGANRDCNELAEGGEEWERGGEHGGGATI
jgi:hypothetical protein